MEQGQLSIEITENGNLFVTLQNFPTPDDTTTGLAPDALYEDPETGELNAEPPVHRDQIDEGEILLRRDDNDEVCGFIITKQTGFSYGDSVSLINYEKVETYLSVNSPEL